MSAQAAKTGPASVRLRMLAALFAAVVAVVYAGCGGSGAAAPGMGGRGGTAPGAGGRGGRTAGGSAGGGQGGSALGGAGGPHGTGGQAGSAQGGRGGISGVGGGTFGGGGNGGAAPGCLLSIQTIPSGMFTVEAGPGVTMRVQGSAYGTALPLTWSWTVTYSDGNASQIPTTPIDLEGAVPGTVVEFPVEKPGRYLIDASVKGDVRCTMATQVVVATASTGMSFTFRTTAPGLPIQETRLKLSDGPAQTISLDSGLSVAIDPVEPAYHLLLPSYVRISSPNTGFDIEGDTTRTPMTAMLLPYRTYDVLIVPDGAFAPLLISLDPMSTTGQTVVDTGVNVLGRTLAADGTPVANARMLLKRGPVSSTVGTSDASGALALLARAGSMTATIVPPDGSGLPIATTTGTIDLAATDAPALTMQWDDLPSGSLTVRVRAPDGVTPVANADVWLASAGAAYRAGVLSAGSAVTLNATASVSSAVMTGDDGQATFPPYPAGAYALTIVPPSSAGPGAVTTTSIDLPAGGATQDVTLAGKVTLTGALAPAPASAGALITAVDTGTPATGSVVATRSDGTGAFSLSVDPNRTFELILQPSGAAARSLGRAVVKASSATMTKNLGVITLPAGQPFQGTVVALDSAMASPRPRHVANAYLQVYCVSSSLGCVDPTVSLAEATSLGDGTFTLTLPQSAASVTSALTTK